MTETPMIPVLDSCEIKAQGYISRLGELILKDVQIKPHIETYGFLCFRKRYNFIKIQIPEDAECLSIPSMLGFIVINRSTNCKNVTTKKIPITNTTRYHFHSVAYSSPSFGIDFQKMFYNIAPNYYEMISDSVFINMGSNRNTILRSSITNYYGIRQLDSNHFELDCENGSTFKKYIEINGKDTLEKKDFQFTPKTKRQDIQQQLLNLGFKRVSERIFSFQITPKNPISEPFDDLPNIIVYIMTPNMFKVLEVDLISHLPILIYDSKVESNSIQFCGTMDSTKYSISIDSFKTVIDVQ
jgi:hypothetical protein